jgi:hypothetical protein
MAQLKKAKLHVADIFRHHMEDYRKSYRLGPQDRKIVSDITRCRTAYLGGHIERCTHCGAQRITYHSCRNRHCPTCQHIVLNILFQSVSKSLLCFGRNELGGKLGFMAILHSWDQHLKAHVHLHCLVAGGALSADGSQWIACQHNYLFNQEALSRVFRGKFMELTTRAFRRGALHFTGSYSQLKNTLYDKTWVVSVRDPIKRPQGVLQYLARYTHRVAIANSRLVALKKGTVTFTYKHRDLHIQESPNQPNRSPNDQHR